MANVLFKRGPQSGLPAQANQTSANVVDGALYFTTDTKRLFLGNGSMMLPIAEGITTVETVTTLPTASSGNEGQFYYVSGGNILAYSDGSDWHQVNSSSQVSAFGAASSASNGNGAISLTITSDRGDGSNTLTHTATVSLFGGDNVSLTTSGTGLVIAADDTTYEMASATSTYSNAAAIALTETAATATSTDYVHIVGGNGVTVSRDSSTGAINLSVATGEVGTISTMTGGNGNFAGTSTNGFYAHLVTSNGQQYDANIDPQIAYGKEHDQVVHFQSGTATIDVYTKSEVDTMVRDELRGLDAMTYVGTASAATDITGASAIHNGDTWKATDTFSIGGETARPGYLIIAKGDETDGVIPSGSVSYDVVAGDSIDHTYTGTTITHGAKVHGDIETTDIMSLALAEGAGIDLSDAVSGVANVVTVSLEPVTVTASTGSAIDQSAAGTTTISVITAVETDSFGRVSSVETSSVTLKDTNLSTATVSASAANNVATVKTTINDSANGKVEPSFTIGTSSNSALAFTASGNAVTVDLVWEDFT